MRSKLGSFQPSTEQSSTQSISLYDVFDELFPSSTSLPETQLIASLETCSKSLDEVMEFDNNNNLEPIVLQNLDNYTFIEQNSVFESNSYSYSEFNGVENGNVDLDLENSLTNFLLQDEIEYEENITHCSSNQERVSVSTIQQHREEEIENRTDESLLKHQPNNTTVDNNSNKTIEFRHTKSISKSSFQCSQCSSTFSNASNLRAHGRVHTGEKPYQCTICHKSFSRGYGLKKHLHSHNNNNNNSNNTSNNNNNIEVVKEFQCPNCPKSFNFHEYLVSHLKSHLNLRSYTCSTCHKSFNRKSELNQHTRAIHLNDRRFLCSYCSKSFTCSASMKTHERQHTGLKPYTCTICSKAFRTLASYNEHGRVHSKEKPYSCNICPKSFPTSSYLSLHIKRHLGVYKFNCGLCGLGFIRGSDYKRHLKLHLASETKRFTCKECNESFCTKTSLEAHEIIHA